MRINKKRTMVPVRQLKQNKQTKKTSLLLHDDDNDVDDDVNITNLNEKKNIRMRAD